MLINNQSELVSYSLECQLLSRCEALRLTGEVLISSSEGRRCHMVGQARGEWTIVSVAMIGIICLRSRSAVERQVKPITSGRPVGVGRAWLHCERLSSSSSVRGWQGERETTQKQRPHWQRRLTKRVDRSLSRLGAGRAQF